MSIVMFVTPRLAKLSADIEKEEAEEDKESMRGERRTVLSTREKSFVACESQ